MSKGIGQRIDDLTVTVAQRSDIAAAADILEEAIAWAAAHGYDTWRPGAFHSPDGSGRARLEEAQEAGALHLVWDGGAAIATFTLLVEDPLYWPGASPDALYFHRFAVRRSHAGIGPRILEWVAAETRRRGRDHVRLDCVGLDQRIRAYYEAAGFQWRGDTHVAGRLMSLYERPLRG